MNEFCLHVANEAIRTSMAQNSKKNFASSPLSVAILLKMLANGCSGEVQEMFLRVLGLTSDEELKETSRMLIAVGSGRRSAEKGGPELLLANGAWFEQTCGVNPCFDQILRSIFKTKPLLVDFRNKGAEVVNEVNGWVNEKTKGLIKKIMSADEGTKDKCQILANALYFKGKWLYPFYENFTVDKDFYLLEGNKLRVPFMNKYGDYFPHTSFKDIKHGFQVLKLPYKFAQGERRERKFSMYVFLPDEKDGLKNLIDHIDSNPGFLNRDFDLHNQKITVLSIPKFKFSVYLNISIIMKSLGFSLPYLQYMDLLLEKNIPEEPRQPKILHACFIEVDEEGTRAAAVTEESDDDMGFSLYDSPPRSIIKFIADHPFLFMIREDVSGIPFFVGTVLNPESEGEGNLDHLPDLAERFMKTSL